MTAFSPPQSFDIPLLDDLVKNLSDALQGCDVNAQEADRGLLGGLGLAMSECTQKASSERGLFSN